MKRHPTHAGALAALLSLFALAASAGAQGKQFQGTVTFQTADGHTLDYLTGQGKARIDVSSSQGEAAVIVDPAAKAMYAVVPSQHMYMQMAIPAGQLDSTTADVKMTDAGRSDVIAGHKCEYWHITGNDGSTADVCLADDMGNFFIANPMQSHAPPAWQRALGGRDAFPLKVIAHKSGEDEVALVATKIDPTPVDPSLFTPPAGYQKMTMPAGMQLPGRP